MPNDSKALEQLSRDELIAKAKTLGADRPELLTRPELRDEIIRLSTNDIVEKQQARGWFGVARDLVASVVSQGLNLPDTADLIRGVNVKAPKAGPPVATVTLAEIYAAQGHVSKALALLDEVLAKEPDHEAARVARQRYAPVAEQAVPSMSPEPEDEFVEAEVPKENAAASEGVAGDRVEPAPEKPECEISVPLEPPGTAENAPPRYELAGEESAEKVGLAFEDTEEDLLLFVHRGGTSKELIWQLGRRSKARFSEREPGTTLVVKVLEVETGWDGPVSRESLVTLDEARGKHTLPSVATEVRSVLGWLKAGRFTPLCLGVEFSSETATGVKLLWAPPVSRSNDAWERLGQQRLAENG